MANLSEIAKLAGVSIAAVSYALNDKDNISEETKQKIIKIAEEVGYKIPESKKYALKRNISRKRNLICMLLNSFNLPFYGKFIAFVEELAIINKLNLMVINTPAYSDDEFYQHIFSNEFCCGFIVLSSTITNSIIIRNATADTPIVTLDRQINADYVWSVTVDNYMGAYNAVKYLIQSGFKEIGFMGTASNDYEITMRYKGYCDALKETGIPLETQLYCQGAHTKEGGYATAKVLILRGQIPKAIFCSNDEMALGLLDACTEAGIRVPEDISIVGFDDIDLAAQSAVPLTTIRQPLNDLANLSMQTIIMAVRGSNQIKHTVIAPKFIVRKSVRKRQANEG